jgi:hypothetical protein
MHGGRMTAGLLGLVVGGLLAGCGGKAVPTNPEHAQRQTELKQIWEVYTSYLETKHRPPAGLADVKGYGTVFSEGLRAVREGRVVVNWGVADPTRAAARQVLAYDKDTPTQGGLVVFGDGTVKEVTPEEFRAAKAGG